VPGPVRDGLPGLPRGRAPQTLSGRSSGPRSPGPWSPEGPGGALQAPGRPAAAPAGVVLHQPLGGPQKGPKSPFMGLDRQKRGFWPKSPKIAIFRHFPAFCPGSYRAKKGSKPQKRAKSPKGAKSPGPGPRLGGGFTSTPRVGALSPVGGGLKRGSDPRLAGRGLLGPKKGPFPVPGTPVPGTTPVPKGQEPEASPP